MGTLYISDKFSYLGVCQTVRRGSQLACLLMIYRHNNSRPPTHTEHQMTHTFEVLAAIFGTLVASIMRLACLANPNRWRICQLLYDPVHTVYCHLFWHNAWILNILTTFYTTTWLRYGISYGNGIRGNIRSAT